MTFFVTQSFDVCATTTPTEEANGDGLIKPRKAKGRGRRSKRSKYTAVACNRCKERKTKCLRPSDQQSCQGCVNAGVPCTNTQFARRVSQVTSTKSKAQIDRLNHEVEQLRRQVASLTAVLHKQIPKAARAESRSQSPSSNCHYQAMPRGASYKPKEPQFIGYTRSDYGLSVAKSSLTFAGASTVDALSASTISSIADSPREETPEIIDEPASRSPLPQDDPLLSIERSEILRLMDVYHEELHSVYPVFDTRGFVESTILLLFAHPEGDERASALSLDHTQHKDIRLLKIALAASIVIEAQGKSELAQRLVNSIECDTSHVAQTTIDLREVQISTIMSIYFFHCSEDLLAWRSIGMAARQAFEMGLHHKATLLDTFRDPESQTRAITTFWCVYVLDKRWSFGISLPFVIVDRDIDIDIPEPSPGFAYLRCTVGYGKLYAKLWETLPPVGSPLTNIPSEQVLFLDFLIQRWISSIPPDLQFHHPGIGYPRNEPQTLRRQRVLLYLRGNHIKTLLHRHYVLSTVQIYSDLESAQLAVDIAKDSINILLDLAKTSEIYKRQQVAFNFFLLNALAILMLALCHAPEIFSGCCRESLLAAAKLARDFARESEASKKSWHTIRGLLPAIEIIGQEKGYTLNMPHEFVHSVPGVEGQGISPTGMMPQWNPAIQDDVSLAGTVDVVDYFRTVDISMVDAHEVGNRLTDIFNRWDPA